ncbi:MAG: hypothetical protein ABSC35_05760 [Candidatus Dormibacteria bacterium]
MPLTPDRAVAIYRDAFSDTRRERLFLSSVSFFTTFAATRAITHAIKDGVGPFHNLSVGGRHFHHLVIGITGLLGTGYLWLLEVDTARKTNGTGTAADAKHSTDDALAKFTSILYGGSSALTLDEFALWLDLEDVYWSKQGRASVDAVVLFGGVLSIGVWGGPFFRRLFHEISHI